MVDRLELSKLIELFEANARPESVTAREAELQKWAMSLVTLLAGALVGYLTGKQSR